jgi:fumarate reductase flavoprotein subunit
MKRENAKRRSNWLALMSGIALLGALSTTPASAQKAMTADLVVIGAGGSGMSAARQAQMSGVKDIVVLEKQPIIGGTSNFCEGMFAVESSEQTHVGIGITREYAFRFMMDYSHWRADPRILRAFINKSAESIDWMKTNGVKFKYVAAVTPGAPLTWHVFDGLCKGTVAKLAANFKDGGGQILTSTPGKSLIKDKGAVVGVVAEQDGQPLNIRAKAVIIATGGYANSKEMLAKYTNWPETAPIGNIGKTGDGLLMAWAAGADHDDNMGLLQSNRPGLPGYGHSSHLMGAARQPYLWVDSTGRRYFDETLQTNWPFAANALAKAGGKAISIFDETTRKHLVESHGVDTPNGEWLHVGDKLTKFDEEFKKELATGKNNVILANSVDELAQKAGLDLAVLKQTIDEANEAADTRTDSLFYKNPKFLRSFKTPPFYAVRMFPTMLGTLGGIRISDKMEAVDKDRKPVPGLYAVGTDSIGGLFGDSYDLVLAGSTMGFAVMSGRIAGENAAKYIATIK